MTTLVTTNMIDQAGNVNFTGPNVSLGSIANVHISGGASGQVVVATDSAGNLAFTNINARITGYNLVFGG